MSLRSGLGDRLKPRGAVSGDLLGSGDRARGGAGRSRSKGDLDLRLNIALESLYSGTFMFTNLSSLLGGDLSLLGENLLGGLLARGGDLGLARQLSLGGVRSLLGGVLDLRRGDRSLLPGCQLSLASGGDLALSRRGDMSLSGRNDLEWSD